MNFIDLHTHSYYSDGMMSPAGVVALANKVGLKAVALTDHDCILGITEAEAKAKEIGITFVRGIEITAAYPSAKQTHILGYFLKDLSVFDELTERVIRLQIPRIEKTIQRINSYGADISWEHLHKFVKGVPMFGHIVMAMIDTGFSPSHKEAKKMVYGMAGTRTVKSDIPAKEAIALIHKAGGQAFLAHPYRLGFDYDGTARAITALKDMGLDGLECYHSGHTLEMANKFLGLAADLNLKISGGTDFHGKISPDRHIGRGYTDDFFIPYSVYKNLTA